MIRAGFTVEVHIGTPHVCVGRAGGHQENRERQNVISHDYPCSSPRQINAECGASSRPTASRSASRWRSQRERSIYRSKILLASFRKSVVPKPDDIAKVECYT